MPDDPTMVCWNCSCFTIWKRVYDHDEKLRIIGPCDVDREIYLAGHRCHYLESFHRNMRTGTAIEHESVYGANWHEIFASQGD